MHSNREWVKVSAGKHALFDEIQNYFNGYFRHNNLNKANFRHITGALGGSHVKYMFIF